MTDVPKIADHANEAVQGLMKRGTMIALTAVVAGVVIYFFWPQIEKISEAERKLKAVPDLEKRVGALEVTDKDATVDRREIRRDLKDLEKRVDRAERVQERFFPPTPNVELIMPGWQTTVERKKGPSP